MSFPVRQVALQHLQTFDWARPCENRQMIGTEAVRTPVGAQDCAIEGAKLRRSRLRMIFPLNNNRNNRRRGRGNNRSQGGSQLNRIDSRARGNAPQLLEKYRKMAQDASLNGDRVQAEYYLQFADHYFRVLADGRARQEEQRPRRDDARYSADDGDYDEDQDQQAYDAPREADRPRDRGPGRGPREDARPPVSSSEDGDDEGQSAAASQYEPTENPFTRRAPRGRGGNRREREANDDDSAARETGFDPAVLPPSIAVREEAPEAPEDDEKPAPRKRTRRARPAAEEGGEPLEKVG